MESHSIVAELETLSADSFFGKGNFTEQHSSDHAGTNCKFRATHIRVRRYSSTLVWEAQGHLLDPTLLALVLHLAVGDTWNTVNNVERRMGAAVPGVVCVWGSVVFAAFQCAPALTMRRRSDTPKKHIRSN